MMGLLDNSSPSRPRENHSPTATAASRPPARPSLREERWAQWAFAALAPRVRRIEVPPPPERLRPWRTFDIPRLEGSGRLAATWFPALGQPRGAVLLLPPWLDWGRSYFHRRRRLETLRQAGFHTLTVDLPGLGESDSASGFADRAAAEALAELSRRSPDLPLFVWGVSSGGYWCHIALSGNGGRRATGGRSIEAAVFEDVSPHLIEWASQTSPLGRPCHALFRLLFPHAFRFLDLRRHAPALGVGAVRYVAGDADPGIPARDTRDLARLAGGTRLLVPGAGHLQAIKLANRKVLDLALETFTDSL